MGRAAELGLRPNLPGSVATTGLWRKIFLELALDALEILRLGRGFLLLGNIGPGLGVLGIHLEPFFEAWFRIRLDCVRRAFGFANAAIDAFVRMNHQHVLALVETVYRAHLHAIGVFALDAGFCDDVSHPTLRTGRFGAIWRGFA